MNRTIYFQKLILLSTIYITCLFCISATATVIYTDISQDSLTLGEKLQFTVSLVTPQGAQIIPPETENGFGKLIVKNYNENKIENKNYDSTAYIYILTIYEIEQCSIPKLPFIEVKGDKFDTLYSDLIPIRAISVITANENDTVQLKDLKGQQTAGTPSLLWLWVLLSIITIAGIIYLIRYLWIKSRKPPPPPPPKPPYDEAIEALGKLQNKNLLTKGLIREYVFELSEILKRYIDRRFDSNAADFTTEEMLQWLKTIPFKADLCKIAEWFFNTTHPVKFAKMIPDNTTVKQLYDETHLFIEKTRPSSNQTEGDLKNLEATS